MRKKELQIEVFQKVLIVEGYSDLLFYAEVLESAGKPPDVFIKQFGGKDLFQAQLRALLDPEFLKSKSHIAVIIDADTNPQSTVSKFEKLLSEITTRPVSNAKWSDGTPRIGLFVVPSPEAPGEIETLVWNSWAADLANAPLKDCIEQFVACMRSGGAQAQSPDKALISALLAVKHDDDPRLGPGARKKIFDLKRPELQSLREFLSGF